MSTTSEEEPVVVLDGLGIRYRRYTRRAQTLKDRVISFLTKSKYEDFWALRGISLEVRPGDSLGIIGPNGAGKSTLLKAIARVLPPSVGRVSVRGKVAPLLELGAGFKSELTGRENVFLNAAIMGLPRHTVEDRLPKIIQFAGIGDFIDAPLSTYSSGMRARLGFAVATEVRADILLIDETLSVGDRDFKRRAGAHTRQFFESKHTVLLVSHSLHHIRTFCNRAILMDQGEIVVAGEPDDVIEEYSNRFD